MTSDRPERFRIGDLILDVEAGEVRRAGCRLPVPPRTFELLLALVRHYPATARRGALLEEVWPDEFVTDQTLTHRVMVLRKALGDHADDAEYVASDRGWGYRLVAPVEELEGLGSAGPAGHPSGTGPGRGGLTIALALLLLTLTTASGHVVPPPTRVAVRPFAQNVSPRDLEVYGEELGDGLRRRLRRMPGLELAAWEEASRPPLWFDGRVEGRGDRLRLRLQLFDGVQAEPIWSRDLAGSYYELRSRDSQVLHEAAAAVREQVAAPATCGLAPLVSAGVERLCLRGRFFWLSWSSDGLRRARESWLRAATLAPDHAPAVAGLSLAGSVQGMMGDRTGSEAGDEAESLARRALALDPTLPDAHLALGLVRLLYRADPAGAERSLLRARERAPDDLAAALGAALLLQARGRFSESLEVLRAAPGPGLESAAALLLQGRALVALDRFGEAEERYLRATRVGSPPAAAWRGLAEVRSRLGRDRAALEALQQEARLRGSLALPDDLASAWANLCETGVLNARATVRACLKARRCSQARRVFALGLAERQAFAALVPADPRYRDAACELPG